MVQESIWRRRDQPSCYRTNHKLGGFCLRIIIGMRPLRFGFLPAGERGSSSLLI